MNISADFTKYFSDMYIDDYYYYKNLLAAIKYENEMLREALLEELVIYDRAVKNIMRRSSRKNKNNKYQQPYVKKNRY
jgi:hypothetical protein